MAHGGWRIGCALALTLAAALVGPLAAAHADQSALVGDFGGEAYSMNQPALQVGEVEARLENTYEIVLDMYGVRAGGAYNAGYSCTVADLSTWPAQQLTCQEESFPTSIGAPPATLVVSGVRLGITYASPVDRGTFHLTAEVVDIGNLDCRGDADATWYSVPSGDGIGGSERIEWNLTASYSSCSIT